jgi:ribonuclease HI
VAETHQLIPPQHYGGRPGRTAEEAMTTLTEGIRNAWKEGDIYSAVFMDVAGAFNNVHHKRLIHNMRKRRVPEFIVRWTESFLKDRYTQLRFNGIDSTKIATDAGVPQGSPMSPILYLFYNADLLEIPKNNGVTLSLGFIDDIAYGVQGQSDVENVRELRKMLQKAEIWRGKHGARFETSKYVLIHFSKRRTEATANITINDTTIEPSREARYLGVIFDSKLRFSQHIQHVTKKGTKFALAISRISKCTWGATYRQTRTLFTSVVAPRIDYAAIVWHRPKIEGHFTPSAQLTKIESAQRTAMKAILGVFRTTATSAMEIETSLEPAHLRIRKKVLKSYTRMQTAPDTHPINRIIRRAKLSKSNKHITGFEYLARTFPQYTSMPVETIKPFIRPPWWTPPHQIDISTSKKIAKLKHNEAIHDPGTLCIYTDGSGINNHIGAAAFSPRTSETRQLYLGTAKEFNVYTAELSAIELAADIAITTSESTTSAISKCLIYTDSQAAIKATVNPDKQSGQAILSSAIDKLEKLVTIKNIITEIVWIPGHMDIEGNEKADTAAKEAAKSTGNSTPSTIPKTSHLRLKTSQFNTINQATMQDWLTSLKTQKTKATFGKLTMNTNNVYQSKKLYSTISKRHDVAQLARLRTGHCSLNQYLHRFGIEESPFCSCNSGAIETVDHYLIHCSKYDRQRSKLIRNAGIDGMWVEKLLGEPKLIKYTLEYVKETGRFPF